MMDIKKELLEIIKIIENEGYKAYIVGGYTRDKLLYKVSNDYDITTTMPLEKVSKLFELINTQSVDTNIETDVLVLVYVKYKDIRLEISRLREELYDANYDLDKIVFTNDLMKDSLRRDFTINSIYYNDDFIDLHSGKEAIEERLIKTVKDPNISFKEDYKRILRALRFMVSLNFKIEEKTKLAILANYRLIDIEVSDNALEIKKIFKAKYFNEAYSEFKEVFDYLGFSENEKLIKDRSILSTDLLLLSDLVFNHNLNYDNPLIKQMNFTLKDKKFILKIKPIVKELQFALSEVDVTMLFLAYGKNVMAKVYDICTTLKLANELNLLHIKKISVIGYLRIDQVNIILSDISDSYTVKQKYSIIKDIQKLIIKDQLRNDRQEILLFIQNNYRSI